MRIIISPAKKMGIDLDSLPYINLPIFLDKTKEIKDVLSQMSFVELKKLWNCNESIAELNYERLRNMELSKNLTPAILSYEGIQYQYMAPGVLEEKQLEFLNEHVRIVSGFYGLVRPFDGVVPYRLEMQAKIKIEKVKNLYEYWGDNLADSLSMETDLIINLASKEYSKAVVPYLPNNVRVISCQFAQMVDGKLKEKGTMCKMARGEMVRFLAENLFVKVEDIKAFNRLNYKYSEEYSSDDNLVFVKNN